MRICLTFLFLILVLGLPVAGSADELAEMAQKDLVALGYDPGNTGGEVSTQTVIAISKFQAEHDMEVTGEVTPQLVGALRAALKQQDQPAEQAATVAADTRTPAEQEADLRARQQACLQEKIAANQEKQKKKRGMMRILSAVSRTSRQFGDGGMASSIAQASSEAYNASATAEDLSGAAKDLGLTEDEMEECRSPQ